MRRDCQPSLVNKSSEYVGLERVDIADRIIGESWLQEALHKSPQILPVSDLDSSFAPIVSLGREINRIDNLFIAPNGRITLVETKLWRNPQAVREVVAQILDYAKVLTGMSYEEFEQAVRKAKETDLKPGQSLYEFVNASFPDEDMEQKDFIDDVQKTLLNSRFMLLIVGDGIRENIEEMLGLMHQQPQMLFTFGLVEMQIYENESLDGRLIVPQLVAHSTEIVRAVVRVKTEGKAEVSVAIEDEKKVKKQGSRIKLDEDEFYDAIRDDVAKEVWPALIDRAVELGFSLHFASSSVAICTPRPHNDGTPVRLVRLFTGGNCRIPNNKFRKDHAPSDRVREELLEMTGDIGKLFNIPSRKDKPLLTQPILSRQLADKQEELIDILVATRERIKELG